MKSLNSFYSSAAVILMMLLSVLVAGGTATGEAVVEEPANTLTGIVYDFETDSPLAGIYVILYDGETEAEVMNVTTGKETITINAAKHNAYRWLARRNGQT